MNDHPKKIIVDFGMLAAATLFCFCFVGFRIVYAGRTGYIYLFWNLFLAWIPLLFAIAAEHFYNKKKPSSGFLIFGFFWMLFFPNAPYIVTDFSHLRVSLSIPLWFDVVMIASFAGTGILLGLCSLQIMGRLTLQKFGAFWSWLFVVISSLLAGFGIYLGRYLRWNSWDVLLNPGQLFQDISNRILQPLSYPQTWFISFLFAALVISSFLIFTHFCEYRHRKKN